MKDRDSKTQNTGSNTVDPTDLEAVKVAYRNILGEDVDGEMDWDLFAAIQSQLHTLQYEYEIYEQSYYARYPFGEVFREAVEQLTEWTDNTSGPPELFQELLTCPEPVRKLFSDCRAMKKFVADQLVHYARIQEFHEGYMENLSDALLLLQIGLGEDYTGRTLSVPAGSTDRYGGRTHRNGRTEAGYRQGPARPEDRCVPHVQRGLRPA
jgi:hypothetical protein